MPKHESEPQDAASTHADQADGAESAGNGNAAEETKAEAPVDPSIALREQLLRMAADFDNFRKRTRREQEELRRYGIETLLVDLLPVLDNLERALSHSEGDKSPVVTGVRMVVKQFGDVLTRFGVQTFPSVGTPFDPERHEAVGQAPANAQHPPGTIVSEAQRGYVLHDRLLRPARVVVASGPANTDEAN